MFDGSHRQRRTIDLSGRSSSRRKANNKAALLEAARIQREGRRLEQRRLDSCKKIQRTWRGYHCRKCIVHSFLQKRSPLSLSLAARLLSPSLLSFLSTDQILSILLSLPTTNTTLHQQQQSQQSQTRKWLLAGRICRLALQHLRQSKLSEEQNQKLLHLISTLLTSSSVENNNNTIVQILKCKIPTEQEDGILLLFLCFKDFYLEGSSNVSSKQLLELSCKAALELQGSNDLGLSILASILFCHQPLVSSSKQNDALDTCLSQYFGSKNNHHPHSSSHEDHDSNNPGHYKVLLQSIVNIILWQQQSQESTTTEDGVNIFRVVNEIISGREWFLLYNAIHLLESSSNTDLSQALSCLCIPLIQYTFQTCDFIRVLSALPAQGENLLQLGQQQQQQQQHNHHDHNMNAMDDDASDDEGMEPDEMDQTTNEHTNHAQVTSRSNNSNRTTTTHHYLKQNYLKRLTRQDVQTVSKLNRLYKNHLQTKRQHALNVLTSSLESSLILQLVDKLGNGDLMKKIGLSIFSYSNDPNTMAKTKENYCILLYHLLQFCTDVQTKQNALSPLMSKLGFSLPILENIWAQLLKTDLEDQRKDSSSKAPMIVFCDLFSHHLLAVDDDEFLANFTGPNVRINAQDVIVSLRSILYDLYWTKPVLIHDVTPSDNTSREHRVRLMLSGTKLWNSLYERWSRLFRITPFCSEDHWWFPTLVTKDQDEEGAVSNDRSMGMFDDGNPSPMDIDDSNNMSDDDDNNDDSVDNTNLPSVNNTVENENEALASSFRDPKMARILTSIPQSLPFDRRVKLFNSLLNADKIKFQDEASSLRRQIMGFRSGFGSGEFDFSDVREKVEIHRDALFDDSMQKLNPLGKKLRKRVQVTFINQHGAHEAGIDGGGVFKEFLDDLIKEAFQPETPENGTTTVDNSFFVESPVQTLAVNVRQLNPSSSLLSKYEFLGRVLGKAVYEGILVEPQFCLPFLNQLLGKQNTLDDLKNLDPEYYKHLTSLRHMNQSEIESLTLSFELFYKSNNQPKHLETVELIPNGSSISVTKENVVRYIHLVAHRRMNIESSLQTRAFLRGFRDLIPAAWVRIFSAYELQKLIGGDDTIKGIDVDGMKSAMQYSGGYHPSQSIIHSFWEVIEEMSAAQQRKFLKFMTSCSRQPLLGFKALVPLPCIQQIRLPEDQLTGAIATREIRLPTSSTCMNLLKLPNYKSKEILKEKLLYAIESGSGFELT